MPKFKTFTTEQGFFELAVAASSRTAALRAWGMKHDLFAQGLARESKDKQTAAALAQPGAVLRRPLGSKGAFGTESVLPKVKNVPPKAKKKARAGDRDAREKAAKALKELDESHRRRLAALQEELRGVQTQIQEVSRTWKDRRKQFTSSRLKARR
jgi:colicin import membrane protein